MKPNNSFLPLAIVGAVVILASPRAMANLVLNGSFQTGDYTDWTVTQDGNPTAFAVAPGYDFVESSGFDGLNYAYVGPISPPDVLSQTINTVIGDNYDFSFELYHSDESGPPSYGFNQPDSGAQFTASIGGNLLLTESGGSEASILGSWQSFSYDFEATGTTTAIDFSIVSPPGGYGLTDIDVEPVGVPDSSSTLILLAVGLGCLTVGRRIQRQFFRQLCCNLG